MHILQRSSCIKESERLRFLITNKTWMKWTGLLPSHSNSLPSPSFGWCIRPFRSAVIIDSRLTRSPRRALSGGLLGLGISVLKILGFDRVNTCRWANGFEHSVNTASDYCKQILRPRGMGVKCFLAPKSHLRGVKRIISRVFSQLWETKTFPTHAARAFAGPGRKTQTGWAWPKSFYFVSLKYSMFMKSLFISSQNEN